MHFQELVMEINVVQNNISDNFYFDYKAAQSNLTVYFACTSTNCKNLKFLSVKKGQKYMSRQADFWGLFICYSRIFKLSMGKNLAWSFEMKKKIRKWLRNPKQKSKFLDGFQITFNLKGIWTKWQFFFGLYEPNGIPYSSYSKGKQPLQPHFFQLERNLFLK